MPNGSTTSGDIVVSMALAISAPDLYKKCTKAYLEKDPFLDLSSSSGPKTHTILNYIRRFPVKYMVQQRMIRKTHDYNHYTNTIFKYACEYAVNVRDICSFICRDHKHKISMGESSFPLAAVPRGRQVLAAKTESFQMGDHNFPTISLISTVILVNNIPESADKSWYCGRPYVGIKNTATDPSTSLQKATKIASVLVEKYGYKEAVPPVLILYIGGGPKHQTTSLTLKIALIC